MAMTKLDGRIHVRIPRWQVGGFVVHEFEPWFSQTVVIKINTCLYIAKHLVLLGHALEVTYLCLFTLSRTT